MWDDNTDYPPEELWDGPTYTIIYEGYLFDGDTEGFNKHDYNSWDEVKSILENYPSVTVRNNVWGIYLVNGEWC